MYLLQLYRQKNGGGLSDILLEASIVGSGTVSGKNYSRDMVCHKKVPEALERLLLKRFLVHNGEKEHFENISAMSKDKLKTFPFQSQRQQLNPYKTMQIFSPILTTILYSKMRYKTENMVKLVNFGSNMWNRCGWLEKGEHLWCKNDHILPKSLIYILDSSICSLEDDDIGEGGGKDSFEYDSDNDDSSDDLI